MRLAAVLLMFVCLSGCSVMSAQQSQPYMSQSDEVRQKQALQDADVILQGMAQARQRAQELARSSR